MIQLLIDLTHQQDLRLDEAKHKFLPSQEDLNPNTRFVDNELVKVLKSNTIFTDFVSQNNITWNDDLIFLRLMLDKLTHSEEYQTYMSMDKTDFASDCEFWYHALKKVILPDDDLLEALENKSVYWGIDDLEIMGQFVLKTIRKIEDNVSNPISPKYKDEEDEAFGDLLFSKTVAQMPQNNELIDQFVKTEKWDSERLALMDRIVMCAALTEIKEFDSIPVNVSLNEYIELAKNFSTPHSGQFVNGILNAVVKHLRSERKLIKN